MKKAVRAILCACGALLLVCALLTAFTSNFNIGVLLPFAAFGVLAAYGLFFERLVRLKILTGVVLAAFALCAAMALGIGLYGSLDNVTFDEDAVVVLGAGIRGERVSRVLAYRLDKAVAYSAQNPAAVIVVSGGQGPQESITEAAAMERYLLSKGVPQDRIIKEESATSTYENLLFAKQILDERFGRPYETVIITNRFHVYRATGLARALGYTATHCGAKVEWYSLPANYARECLAVVKFWVFGT